VLIFLLILLEAPMFLITLALQFILRNPYLIINDFDIKKVVREEIEILLKINNNVSLNRDLEKYSLNAPCTNLIKINFINYATIPVTTSVNLLLLQGHSD
jgi:hypothetical protein